MEQRKKNTKNICMLSFSHFEKDPRVQREAFTLANNGYSVYCICLRNKDDTKYKEYKGIKLIQVLKFVSKIPKGSLSRYFFGFFIFPFVSLVNLFKLKTQIKKISAIHVHNPPDHLILTALPFKILFKTKVIMDRHEPFALQIISTLGFSTTSFLFKLLKVYEKNFNFFSDGIITINRLDNEEMQKMFKRKTVITIGNYLDFTQYQEQNRSVRKKKKVSLIYQGLISKKRDIGNLILGLKYFNEKFENFECLIFGDGDYVEEMNKAIIEYHLENHVIYRGWITRTDLMNEIKNADICIITVKDLPIYKMYTPNKLFEYMYYRKKIIAPNIEFLKELSNNSCYFYEIEDPKDLATKLFEAISSVKEFEEKLTKMSQALDDHNWRNEQEKLVEFYSTITEIKNKERD